METALDKMEVLAVKMIDEVDLKKMSPGEIETRTKAIANIVTAKEDAERKDRQLFEEKNQNEIRNLMEEKKNKSDRILGIVRIVLSILGGIGTAFMWVINLGVVKDLDGQGYSSSFVAKNIKNGLKDSTLSFLRGFRG